MNASRLPRIDVPFPLHVQVQRRPKIPKGTRDLLPDQMAIREMAFRACASAHPQCFSRYQREATCVAL